MVDRPREEFDAVVAARKGEADAWEVIVRLHQQIAFRTAFLIVRDPHEAEDAMQEGFVRAWQALHKYDVNRPLRPWLLSIVANEARNRRRSAGRREGLALRVASTGSGDAVPSPEKPQVAPDERRQLLRAVDDLSEPMRLVVIARYFLELSEEETSEMLGIPPGTVKSRLSRALDGLREKLEAQYA